MAVIYLCPADKRLLCPWEGKAANIKEHFKKEHDNLLYHTNCIDIDLKTLHENRLLSIEEDIYLIQSNIANNTLFIKVRHLGTDITAAGITYDITLIQNNILYEYDKESSNNYLFPVENGWRININDLEMRYGKLKIITCQFKIKKREEFDVQLNINNFFVEENQCDETESDYIETLNFVDCKLNRLKHETSEDIMDKISHLNLSILEESLPKDRKYSDTRWDSFDLMDSFPVVSKGLNLSCSSCHSDMLPPIFLCTNGHNICVLCRTLKCGECSEYVTQFRNTDLENVSRTHKHYCKYASEGCLEKMMYNEVRYHEIRCKFCKYKCANCQFEGKFNNFFNHLKVVHASVKIADNMTNDMPKNVEFFIVNERKGIFHCNSEQVGNLICWSVVYCGPKERLFFCELHFKGSKLKNPLFLKRNGDRYELKITTTELKQMKVKEKYATLTIASYDS